MFGGIVQGLLKITVQNFYVLQYLAVFPDGIRITRSNRNQAAAITLETIAERMQTPAQRLLPLPATVDNQPGRLRWPVQ